MRMLYLSCFPLDSTSLLHLVLSTTNVVSCALHLCKEDIPWRLKALQGSLLLRSIPLLYLLSELLGSTLMRGKRSQILQMQDML